MHVLIYKNQRMIQFKQSVHRKKSTGLVQNAIVNIIFARSAVKIIIWTLVWKLNEYNGPRAVNINDHDDFYICNTNSLKFSTFELACVALLRNFTLIGEFYTALRGLCSAVNHKSKEEFSKYILITRYHLLNLFFFSPWNMINVPNNYNDLKILHT